MNVTAERAGHQEQSEKTQLIMKHSPSFVYGDVIGKISSSFYYVHESVQVDGLANELEKQHHIESLGVVDANQKVIGLVLPGDLFTVLGKRYGRDVYKYAPVSRLMVKVRTFNFHRNIFSVSHELKTELYEKTIRFFLLTTNKGGFGGIFSTKDLLTYMSDITRKDIELAKKLQANIVNDEFLDEGKHLSILGASRMAKGVGGDFYKIYKCGSHRKLVVLCDVSGKGISASLISAIMGGMLSVYDFKKDPIEKFIEDFNSYIYDTFKLEKMVTGLFIYTDEKKGKLTIYDMGHSLGCANMFLIREETFKAMKNKNYNLAMGISPIITVKNDVFALKKNDRLLFITDGFTDQRNSVNEEFGIKRIGKICKKYHKKSLKKMKELLFAGLDSYREVSPQSDDITFILLEYKG